MSILTKISVIIMVVASLVASVVFFNMATVPFNYRQWYEQERDAYQNIEAKLGEVNAALARKNEQLVTVQRDLGDQIASLQRQITDLTATRDNAVRELASTKADLASIDSKLSEVKVSLNAQQEANTQLVEKLDAAHGKLNDLLAENASLSTKLQETTKQNELLDKNLTIAQQKLEERRSEVKTLMDKVREIERLVPGGVATAASEPIAPPGIAGTVTSVRANLASVNVGSAHGVKEGMKLIIYRGDQFVGHLKIEQVRVNEAAGMVTDKRLDPLQGDRVTSPASLNSVN